MVAAETGFAVALIAAKAMKAAAGSFDFNDIETLQQLLGDTRMARMALRRGHTETGSKAHTPT